MRTHPEINKDKTDINSDIPIVYGAGELFGVYECERFLQKVEAIRNEPDKLKKIRELVSAYIRLVGFNPDWVEEIDRLYVRLNLHTKVDNPKRLALIADSLQYFSKNFDHNKLTLEFTEWEDTKDKFFVYARLIDEASLYYTKGKTKTGAVRKTTFSYEDIAFVLYLIAKTNYLNYDNEDDDKANSFSYKQAQGFYKKKFGKALHRNAFSRILVLLQEANLIEKSGEYITGVRGNQYKAQDDIIDILGL